jgi:hypothetical protein
VLTAHGTCHQVDLIATDATSQVSASTNPSS